MPSYNRSWIEYFERILLPIVKKTSDNKEAKPTEVETTENELKYSIPGLLFMDNPV